MGLPKGLTTSPMSIDFSGIMSCSRHVLRVLFVGFRAFHPKFTGLDPVILAKAATVIQRHFRGHYTRKMFDYLKQKVGLTQPTHW